MSYHHYESDCFILDTYESGEASNLYTLLTEDFRLLYARAQGVRLSKSKLRFSLQSFSRARVALVKGKVEWRLVGAQEPTHFWKKERLGASALTLLGRIFKLIRRLVHGEEKNKQLFAIIGDLTMYLEKERRALSIEEFVRLEIVIVARVLTALGYFTKKELYKKSLEEGDLALAVSTLSGESEKALLRDINEALKETQL